MAFHQLEMLLAFLLLMTPSFADDCLAGVEINWDGWQWSSEAFLTAADRPGTHIPWVRGSFLASQTDSHEFTLSSATWDISGVSTPVVFFTLDDVESPHTANSYTLSIGLNRDFRYSFFGETEKDHYYVWIRLEVWWFGVEKHTVDTRCAESCYISGCRDLAIPRIPYACQPSPGFSPSSPVLPSLSISRSARFASSDSMNQSFGFDATHSLVASAGRSASSQLPVSQRLEGTEPLGRTHRFAETQVFAGSDLLADLHFPSANRFTAIAVSLAVCICGGLLGALVVALVRVSRKYDRHEVSEYSGVEAMTDVTTDMAIASLSFTNDDAALITQVNCLTVDGMVPGSLWVE
jgi:hypothetical protein